MSSISLRHISKLYPGNVKAVDDFNLEIMDKEFVVLVGPSGCGKSTTLRMIAGLEDITEGELYIGDKLVNKVHPKDRDIAMVFQNYALYPHMTVYKNLAFALELRKFSKKEIEEKVVSAAKTLQIEPLLQRKPKALSGGQRQRVALGRAMVRDPQVFLLDEPLSNLDAKLRTEMRAEISKLHKKLGATFVYVTHDQMEAMSMGDRIVVMKDGIINQIDTPQKLYENPCNIFVAAFIGSPQMNMVDVLVRAEHSEYYLDFHGKLLKLNNDKFPQEVMEEYVGKTVVMGIRAENIYDNIEHVGNSMEMDVELTELMGSEVHAYMDFMGSRLISKLPSSTKAIAGGKIMIELDVNKIHLFNKEKGNVICNSIK